MKSLTDIWFEHGDAIITLLVALISRFFGRKKLKGEIETLKSKLQGNG